MPGYAAEPVARNGGTPLTGADVGWEKSVPSNVFILGLHRSGTTLLYQMLAAAGHYNVLTARHVVCFGRLRNGSSSRERTRSLLHERLARLGVTSRGVDGVDLSPDTLEEYSFILDNLHAGVSITRRNFHVFRSVLEAIRRDADERRPLLLKNPWDFGNGRLIKSLMPDARIVYIHRNPFHTLSSLHRAILAATAETHAYKESQLADKLGQLVKNLVDNLLPGRPDFMKRLAELLQLQDSDVYHGNITTYSIHA